MKTLDFMKKKVANESDLNSAADVADFMRRAGSPIDHLLEDFQKFKDSLGGTRYPIYRFSAEIPREEVKPIRFEKLNDYSSSRVLLGSLNRYYTEWSAKIGEDFQVAIYLFLTNGSVIKAHVLKEEGFNGVSVEGDLNGLPCLLLLHQSSLQFFCVAEPIAAPEERKKIGFIYEGSK